MVGPVKVYLVVTTNTPFVTLDRADAVMHMEISASLGHRAALFELDAIIYTEAGRDRHLCATCGATTICSFREADGARPARIEVSCPRGHFGELIAALEAPR